MRVEVILFDGFDLLDVFGPLEPLTAAGCEVKLVHRGGPRTVTSVQGAQVVAERGLGAATTDGVLVPGGGWLDRASQGAWKESRSGGLITAIQEARRTAPWMASVCSGGMLLSAAGLLTNRRATTNRACFEEFRPLVGELIDARVVDDGDIITVGARPCGIDLGLHLVRRFVGEDAAATVSRRLECPPPADSEPA